MPVPAPLLHTPAHMLRKYLIAVGIGTDNAALDWCVYAQKMQATKTLDNAIFVVNTTGVRDMRAMSDGVATYHDGIQVMIRSAKDQQAGGFLKGRNAERWLNEHLRLTDVALGSRTYRLNAFTVSSPVTYVGAEENDQRHLHAVNGLLNWIETTPP